MSPYFAMRVRDKYKEGGLTAAKAYYNQMFSIQLYKQFQDDTDAILILDGYADVLPEDRKPQPEEPVVEPTV